MRPVMRLVALCLAFVIAATSQQMAVARGAMADVAGQVVICTGQGVQTITVDRDGAPVDPVHFCPDCALAVSGVLPALPQMQVPLVQVKAVRHCVDVGCLPGLRAPAPFARGPPRLA